MLTVRVRERDTSRLSTFQTGSSAPEYVLVSRHGSPYHQTRPQASSTLGGIRRMNAIRQFIREEDGQDVVEYGLLIATIAIVVLVGISFFGSNINMWFQTLAGRITTTGVS